jgi:hypothetical protein
MAAALGCFLVKKRQLGRFMSKRRQTILVYGFRNSSGSFAIFAAIRRASSLASSSAADRRPGSSSK